MVPVYGLTGGIACGKSAVGEIVTRHGAHVIDADALARAVVAPGSPALAEIRDVFGEGVIRSTGERQAALGVIVFQMSAHVSASRPSRTRESPKPASRDRERAMAQRNRSSTTRPCSSSGASPRLRSARRGHLFTTQRARLIARDTQPGRRGCAYWRAGPLAEKRRSSIISSRTTAASRTLSSVPGSSERAREGAPTRTQARSDEAKQLALDQAQARARPRSYSARDR